MPKHDSCSYVLPNTCPSKGHRLPGSDTLSGQPPAIPEDIILVFLWRLDTFFDKRPAEIARSYVIEVSVKVSEPTNVVAGVAAGEGATVAAAILQNLSQYT